MIGLSSRGKQSVDELPNGLRPPSLSYGAAAFWQRLVENGG